MILVGCSSTSPSSDENDNSSLVNPNSSEISNFPSGLQKYYLDQMVEGSIQQLEYFVRYPSQPNKSNYPIVFYFHGNGGTAENFYYNLSEVHELIDNNNFVGIFPQGLEESWNLGEEASKADDVAWVGEIIKTISEKSFVDSSSVYAVGISNGAGMVNKLAKESDMLKGIAPIVSQQTLALSKIKPFNSVSVFQINGDDDPLIPINGGYLKYKINLFQQKKVRKIGQCIQNAQPFPRLLKMCGDPIQ